MKGIGFAEYLWIDDHWPTPHVRSKARVLRTSVVPRPSELPEWSFDGSATGQSRIEDSDCVLRPARVYVDPLRTDGGLLVLCEVLRADGNPHASNGRAHLRQLLDAIDESESPWLGFEQVHTLFRGERPIGSLEKGESEPQGPYYCAAGCQDIVGRDLVEAHAQACIRAGILFHGFNSEAMPGQWEFQVGYRGISGEDSGALRVADDLWVARYLLHRCGERFGIRVSLDSKPLSDSRNGAGLHANFSTSRTRNPERGLLEIRALIEALSRRHSRHVVSVGRRFGELQAGGREPSELTTFDSGIAHRGASIRIPQSVAQCGFGYLEDRRPRANADPYQVGACLIGTAAGMRGRKIADVLAA